MQHLNGDHDASSYRVCERLHPTRALEIRTKKGSAIVYVCDTCAAKNVKFVFIPHMDRVRGAGEPRTEKVITAIWRLVRLATFGVVDKFRLDS